MSSSKSSAPRGPVDVLHSEDGDIPLTPQELHALEAHERSGRSVENYRRLLRLAKYFRGKMSTQEIMWREGEEGSTIEEVCNEFKLILVVSKRPA